MCNIVHYMYITAVFSVDSLNQQQVHQQMVSSCAHFLPEVGDEMRLVCVTVCVTVEEGITTGKRERACKKRDRKNIKM